jgi:hypothetical protein
MSPPSACRLVGIGIAIAIGIDFLRQFDPDPRERGGDVLVALGDRLVPLLPDPLPRLRREGIPPG